MADEVLALTEELAEWEVIRVKRDASDGLDRALGFDVGWWGGSEFYSIIADTVVAPR